MTPAALLAQARVLAEAYLPDSCAVQELTSTPSGDGGFSEDWATLETVPGLVEADTSNQGVAGEAPRGAVKQTVFLRVTTVTQAIKTSHRIMVAARDGKEQLIITQPKREDESFEALVTISGYINASDS